MKDNNQILVISNKKELNEYVQLLFLDYCKIL